jgi:hypothetical protein
MLFRKPVNLVDLINVQHGSADKPSAGARPEVCSLQDADGGLLVPDVLLFAILLDRLRMILPVLPLITGVGISPLLLAIPHDLGIERIAADLILRR